MTDIVERLCDAAKLFEERGDYKSLPREAADEIGQLRAALKDCEHDLDVFHLLLAIMNKAFADDKRFLAALKQTNAKLRKRKKPAG